jgi:hypothetical protein
MNEHTLDAGYRIDAGLQHLRAAASIPALPLHAAPETPHMPIHVARNLLADEMSPAGDLGLYGGALPSILAARLLGPEVKTLVAVFRALADYRPDCGHGHRLEAL